MHATCILDKVDLDDTLAERDRLFPLTRIRKRESSSMESFSTYAA